MLIDLAFKTQARVQHSMLMKLTGGKNPTRKAYVRPAAGKATWTHLGGWRRYDEGIYYGPADAEKLICLFAEEEIDPKWAPSPGEPSPVGVADSMHQILNHGSRYIDQQNKTPFVLVVTPVYKHKLAKTNETFRWEEWKPYIGDQKKLRNILNDEPRIRRVFLFRFVPLEPLK